jgi:DNA-binding NarL/FixJ family response regulator
MKKFRILIADDHSLIREGVKTLITRNKNITIVGEAANGNQAVELYEKLSPDLVILDISMPQKNGMEAAQEILAADEHANIVMLSMYDDEDYISKCIELGVKGYVIKNESGNELEYAIQAVLSGKTYFSQQAHEVIFKKYTQRISKKKETSAMVSVTKREIEIIKLIAEGLTSQEMANKLFISPRTVETHRSNLMKKMGVKNSIELVRKAQQAELIE